MSAEDLLLIGKITKPHGIRGKVKVFSYAESPELFNDVPVVYIKLKSASSTPLHVMSVGVQGNMLILEFKEIESRNDAEEIAGGALYIDKKYLPSLEEGEYYRYELIGLEVATTEGLIVGTVDDIFPTGSNDVLVVKKGKVENLIPVTREVIKKVDLKQGKILIEPLENMIEGL